MTRALVIEPSGNLWGSERALLDLIDNMSDIQVAVCCPPGTPLESELARRHIRTIPNYIYGLHEKTKWHRLRAAVAVLRSCLEVRADVIYLNQAGSYKVALLAATLLRLPMVAHIRIFEDAAYLAHQSPDSHRLRGLIAISSAIEMEIRRFQALRTIPLHLIYDAYAPSLEPDATQSTDRATNRVACVGRLVPIKGQDVLVAAMGLLTGFKADLECLIIGDGDASFVQRLKQWTLNQGTDSLIRWLGFTSDVMPLLRTCSVLVCPSHVEPLGRVIFEAWDAGVVPVVFSGSGGAAEIVSASNGGLLYDRQEPESLASMLRVALDLDPKERSRLIGDGRSWMANNCNPESYGEALSTILKATCAC